MDAIRPEQAVPVCRRCLSEAVLIKAGKGGLCDKASGVFLCVCVCGGGKVIFMCGGGKVICVCVCGDNVRFLRVWYMLQVMFA